MTRWALLRLLSVVAVVSLLAAPVAAEVAIEWTACEDGTMKMWWMVNTVRITSVPVVDSAMTAGQTVTAGVNDDEINGLHEFWVSAAGPVAETNVTTGCPPPTPMFAETLEPFGGSVSWLSLADADGSCDVAVDVHLPEWAAFLQGAGLPDPNATYVFDDTGHCAALPGYYALDAVTGATYQGETKVIGVGTLTVPEPTALVLLAGGTSLLLRRKRRG